MSIVNELHEFFRQRTIGYQSSMGGWYWRGPGYDEGWDKAPDEDAYDLYMLLGAYIRGEE